MIQVPTPTPAQTFFQQIMPYVISFLAVVIPALGAWIVAALKANHAATVNAAVAANTAVNAIAAHNVVAAQQLTSIESKVNGALTAMTEKSEQQTQAILADKDRQIAQLTKQQNP